VKQERTASRRRSLLGQVIGGCRPAISDTGVQVEMSADRQVDDLGSYFQFPIGLATVVQTFLQTLAYLSGFRAEEAGVTCALCDM
jgi:hypothetical protein